MSKYPIDHIAFIDWIDDNVDDAEREQFCLMLWAGQILAAHYAGEEIEQDALQRAVQVLHTWHSIYKLYHLYCLEYTGEENQ